MTEKEINIEIARTLGWVNESGNRWTNSTVKLCTLSRTIYGFPDYCHDLNAMHEAEKYFGDHNREQFYLYYGNLIYLVAEELDVHPICATAMQRAEAFLRVKGLWK